jgi:hypothetical protein
MWRRSTNQKSQTAWAASRPGTAVLYINLLLPYASLICIFLLSHICRDTRMALLPSFASLQLNSLLLLFYSLLLHLYSLSEICLELSDVLHNGGLPTYSSPSFMKTHQSTSLATFSRIVRTVRDPLDLRDTVKHFMSSTNSNNNRTSTISTDALLGMETSLRQAVRWHCRARLNAYQHSQSELLVHYEDLLRRPHYELARILHFVGINASASHTSEASASANGEGDGERNGNGNGLQRDPVRRNAIPAHHTAPLLRLRAPPHYVEYPAYPLLRLLEARPLRAQPCNGHPRGRAEGGVVSGDTYWCVVVRNISFGIGYSLVEFILCTICIGNVIFSIY